ncbi:hypothetical protein [Bacillus manliponensis]|uniref:hypothetical protein n=1 Tax=Bacillus manliponensis TaxID=574376 RepID=UPI0035191517
MYTVKNNTISNEVIKLWQKVFVPDVDYFFFEEKPTFCEVTMKDTSTIPLHMKTSFLTWSVHKRACYMTVMENQFFCSLNENIQKQILREQVRLNRGFVFEVKELELLLQHENEEEWKPLLQTYSFLYEGKKLFILQGFVWRQFPERIRICILIYIAEMFVEEDSVEVSVPEEVLHIKRYINTFIGRNGPNCLGTTLAAIETNKEFLETYIHEWIQPKEFKEVLHNKNYKIIENPTIQQGDVLVWEENETAVHACYALTDDIVFNKNGQTMFNPYQCVTVKQVQHNWRHVEQQGGRFVIYRKGEQTNENLSV